MHPAVFRAFDELCRLRDVRGRVLEVGATPDASTLLNLPALSGATEKVGVNKAGASTFGGFRILAADANALTCFEDERFDAVLCNAMLEHDPFFWRSLAEMRRVVRRGGFLAIGTPGFTRLPFEGRVRRLLRRLPGPSGGWALEHSTLTLGVHDCPADYYRFTERAFRDVFFEGMADVTVQTLLVPPRLIGSGVRL